MENLLPHLLYFALGVAAMIGGPVAMILLLLWLSQRAARRTRHIGSGDIAMEPPEPGWTEALQSEGDLVYSRVQAFNETLARQDARGRRGEMDMHGE